MKTEHIYFRLSYKGQSGHFSCEGYSKFHQRLAAASNKTLEGEVYGVGQCKEHAEELRNHWHDGLQPYKDTKFLIEKVIIQSEIVEEV